MDTRQGGKSMLEMEMQQMTFEEYLNSKERIKDKIMETMEDFVIIGYELKRIRDTEGYKHDGYKDFTEFAKVEYGLNASTTSKFIAINANYSEGGGSDKLLPQYQKFGYNKLYEMLSLPVEDREQLEPDTTMKEIREIKKFVKEEQVEEQAEEIPGQSNLTEVLEQFGEQPASITPAAVPTKQAQSLTEVEQIIEEVFRGNEKARGVLDRTEEWDTFTITLLLQEVPKKTLYAGKLLVFLKDASTGVKYRDLAKAEKRYGNISYKDFFTQAKEYFAKTSALSKVQQEEPVIQEIEESKTSAVKAEPLEKTEIFDVEKEVEKKPEEVEESLEVVMTRKQYLDTLSVEEAAEYLVASFRKMPITELLMRGTMLNWLQEVVGE